MKAIASKLVKIMEECHYVQKDGTNKFQNYNYASAANVLEKVNESCSKYNIATAVNSKIVSEKERTNAKGNIEILTTVEMTLTLIDGESSETLTITSLGSGQDIGDKGVAKAQTMALKYAWMTTLNISTGDDPEADEGVDERNQQGSHGKNEKVKLSEKQVNRTFAIAKSKGYEPADVKTWALKKYKVTDISDLTKSQYDEFCIGMERMEPKGA